MRAAKAAWLNPLRALTPPKDAVQSLEVQARLGEVEVREQSQFELLVRHFLNSFFQNEMVSADGEAKTHLMQVAYAMALPGVIFAIYLFPPYHAPHPRDSWAQAGDHYFYGLYSLVAIGAITVFEWDLFFPGLVDLFVLSSLPIEPRRLFRARIAAVGIFLGALVLGINLLGIVFFPAAADMPSLARHLMAHLLAVAASGIFAAAFVLALQGVLLAGLGQRIFEKISPLVQGLLMTVLLTMLFLFPAKARFLEALLGPGSAAVRWFSPFWFPPFWFLGIYERLLFWRSAPEVFAGLAATGTVATIGAVALAVGFYPLAYRRRTRQLLEGLPARTGESWATALGSRFFHATVIRTPVRRAVYHFISQTLLRTQRHRVYLAMYGGVGVALILASAFLVRVGPGEVGIVFSPDGLRAAAPIVAFWAVAGVRAAFLAPVDPRGGWIFRVSRGRVSFEELAATRSWVLLWGMALTLGTAGLVWTISPPGLRGWKATVGQGIVAAGLCLLLRDALFLTVKVIPFTGMRSPSKMNLAFVLVQYFGFFPPLIVLAVGAGSWTEVSLSHMAAAVSVIAAAHLVLARKHRRIAAEDAVLLDVDEDEEEFPQRLGLRY